MSERGWIGVDLDGTLARYDGWKGPEHVGEPVGPMLERVKGWLAEGREVRIFTARCWPFNPQATGGDLRIVEDGATAQRSRDASVAIMAIRAWCRQHLGRELPVTCVKDYNMVELWDDRAVQVLVNTGQPAAKPRSCRAVQVSDSMQCRWCGLGWDMNDPNPPECRT